MGQANDTLMASASAHTHAIANIFGRVETTPQSGGRGLAQNAPGHPILCFAVKLPDARYRSIESALLGSERVACQDVTSHYYPTIWHYYWS